MSTRHGFQSFTALSAQALFAMLLALHTFIAAPVKAQEVPFEGTVTEDDVKVRAGAGRTFYVVGSLPKGTKVVVDEVIFGWNKVVPATGIHSYISKAFVDAKGDGKIGEVNRDRAPVNAASLDGPGDSYRHQIDLSKGDRVDIVGEDGSFYKIVPPTLGATKKAYVYLPPGSVRRVVVEPPKVEVEVKTPEVSTPPTTTPPTTTPPTTTPPVTTPPVTTPPATPQVSTPPVTTPPVAPKPEVTAPTTPATTTPETTTPEAPKATIEPTVPEVTIPTIPSTPGKIDVPTPASLQKFDANHEAVIQLEAKMTEALKLSIDKQPIDELLAAYTTAATLQGVTANDKFICKVRIAQLTRNQKVQAAVKSARVSLAADPQAEAKKPEGPNAQRSANYNATGQLLASSVYDGVRLPQLFRVVEPSSNRTIVYVRPGDAFETPKALGRLVGITGKIRFDSSLNLRIIEVEKLDVLDVAEPATTPASAPVIDSVSTTIKVTE